MKVKHLLTTGLSLAIACTGAWFLAQNSVVRANDEYVPITEDNFPDEAFRKYVKENYDVDKDGKLSEGEIEGAEQLNLDGLNVSSLDGVEYLTSLWYICASHGEIESVDVSQNVKLLYLYINMNKLTKIDLSKNTELLSLDLSGNALKSIDLSKNTKLCSVSVGGNQLTSLDLSMLPELSFLNVNENQLTSLDISKNNKLCNVSCDLNAITSLDFSNKPDLEYVACYSNALTSVNFSGNPKLLSVEVSKNKLTELDTSALPELDYLGCRSNDITKLDVSSNTKLKNLDCSNCLLNDLDLTKNVALEQLFIYAMDIRNLNLSKNVALTGLYSGDCSFKSLDVSANTNLEDLYLGNSLLTELDVSKNTKLRFLYLAYSKDLTSIDISNNPALVSVDVAGTAISSLDTSKNKELIHLSVENSSITSLDLSNNAKLLELCTRNPKMKTLDISSCPELLWLIENAEKETLEDFYCYEYFKANAEGVTQHYYLTFHKKTTLIPSDGSSAPSFEDFVERLYTVALGRASEPDGKKYWVDAIVSGEKTGGDCARFFLMGEEFQNRNLSVEDFVETLYLTFFDRESEPNGKAYWVGVLKNGGDRNAVINGFIDSKEWCNICADYGVKSGAPTAKAEHASANAINFATRLYTCCLGREPEEGGLKYWSLALTNLEQTGCSAAKEFFTSAEFINLNLKDDAYITRLYTTFMDREPEEAEVAFWEGEIAKGTQTRASVLAFFGQSEEFTNICKKYGIDRGTI